MDENDYFLSGSIIKAGWIIFSTDIFSGVVKFFEELVLF